MAAQKANLISLSASQIVAEPEWIARNQPDNRPRLEGLTALRFFAALHVILFHLYVEGVLAVGPW